MSTITKPPEEDMSQELSWWILSQAQWTQSELDHLDNFSDPITSFLVKPELVTTGQKDTTLKVLNWLTQSWTSSERKLKVVIASKDSKSLTHLEEEPDQEWELFWSPKSEKNIQTELWKLSQSSHHQKFLTQSLNHTMPPFQSTNWLKMLMNAWLSITKPCMISVSEP